MQDRASIISLDREKMLPAPLCSNRRPLGEFTVPSRPEDHSHEVLLGKRREKAPARGLIFSPSWVPRSAEVRVGDLGVQVPLSGRVQFPERLFVHDALWPSGNFRMRRDLFRILPWIAPIQRVM